MVGRSVVLPSWCTTPSGWCFLDMTDVPDLGSRTFLKQEGRNEMVLLQAPLVWEYELWQAVVLFQDLIHLHKRLWNLLPCMTRGYSPPGEAFVAPLYGAPFRYIAPAVQPQRDRREVSVAEASAEEGRHKVYPSPCSLTKQIMNCPAIVALVQSEVTYWNSNFPYQSPLMQHCSQASNCITGNVL